MQVLKQSTSIDVRIGPFVDATDGVTPETGITLGAADQAEALKANGAATVDISGATWSAVTGADGWYDLTLTASHTDTIGTLEIVVQDSSVCLPVVAKFQVVEESVYDAIYASGAAYPTNFGSMGIESDGHVHADLKEWLGSAPAALSSNYVQTSVAAMQSNVITSAAVSSAALVSGSFDGGVYDTIADSVWDEANSGHVGAGSVGKALNDINTNIGTPSDLGSGATLSANAADMAGSTFDSSTDSLEEIRDRGDAEWTTGSGTGLTALASGTAQAGSTSTTLVLASASSFNNDDLNGNIAKITSGTGAGQSRVITDYVGATDTATVTPAWATTPDATSEYEIVEGSVNISAVSNVAEDISTATAVSALQTTADAIETDTQDIQSRLPAALVGGKIDANIGSADTDVFDAASLATDAVNEIRNAITGGAYALDTDANGRIRIVDGTGTAELDTSSGGVAVASISSGAQTTIETNVDNALTAYSAPTVSDVNAQMVDVMETDTHTEIGTATPPATASYQEMLQYVYKALRNKSDQDATTQTIYNDDGTTGGQQRTVSEVAGTVTVGELVTA